MEQTTLGQRIAGHRKRLKMTQDTLAQEIGVTPQAVSKWENDQSCPDIVLLPRLSEIFGITADELLGVSPKRAADHVQDEEDSAPEIRVETDDNNEYNKYAWFISQGLCLFDENGNEVAYISQNKLYIRDAVFFGTVQFGGYIADTTDGLAFTWVGG